MKYHFISGLPRSGSTLLSNILAQNPRFLATSTSGILDIMFGVRNSWDNLIEFQASPNDEAKKRVLKGILDNYYSDTDKPVVFDKSRGWNAYIEMAEHALGEKVKILVPVRDIRDVVASFEKLWRKTSQYAQVPVERERYFEFQTVQGRVKIWLEGNQPIGLAYNRIKDAIDRGFRDRMHFVKFEELTSNPTKCLSDIYEFLGEEQFKHDFDNVVQVTKEDDSVHGFKGLHDIRSKVEPMKPQWPTVLGKGFRDYGSSNFWDF